jgi:hypothetical protein
MMPLGLRYIQIQDLEIPLPFLWFELWPRHVGIPEPPSVDINIPGPKGDGRESMEVHPEEYLSNRVSRRLVRKLPKTGA